MLTHGCLGTTVAWFLMGWAVPRCNPDWRARWEMLAKQTPSHSTEQELDERH